MTYFKNVKVDDRVYDLLYGWGRVSEISPDHYLYRISVKFDVRFDSPVQYDFNGFCIDSDVTQMLYYSVPKIVEENSVVEKQQTVDSCRTILGYPVIFAYTVNQEYDVYRHNSTNLNSNIEINFSMNRNNGVISYIIVCRIPHDDSEVIYDMFDKISDFLTFMRDIEND